VASVTQLDTQREALRQESVAGIFRAQGLTAQAELMEAQAEQIKHPERKFQYDLALAAFKKAKSPLEIDKLKADTEQARAAGRLSEQRAEEIDRLLDEKKKAIETGNDLRQKQIDEYLTVLFPSAGGGVEPAQVPASEIAKLMAKDAKSDLPERKFLTAQEQQAASVEEIIRGEGIEGQGPESAAAVARYNDFNRYSNRNYIALNIDGRIDFFDLPKIGGQRITARQVYRAAQDANMSVEEYVVEILGLPEAAKALGVSPGKKTIRQPIPRR
jgi:hypothetical protein